MAKITLKNGVEVKRNFYNIRDYTIDYDNNVVVLGESLKDKLENNRLFGFLGYKKVGGSSIGYLTGTNKFGSPFTGSARIMWLNEPILDLKYINAGIDIEDKVLQRIEEVKGIKLNRYDAKEFDYDFFKEEEHIGGLPDGYDPVNKVVYEIKTTGAHKYDSWQRGFVPEYYKEQVALYDYLMHPEKSEGVAHIVATFLEKEDYANPKEFDIMKRNVQRYDVRWTAEEMKKIVSRAESVRKHIIETGTSLPFNLDKKQDKELIEYLECKNEEEFKEWLKKKGAL